MTTNLMVRAWFRDATPGFPVGNLLPITGYLERIEGETTPIRPVLRPIAPDEPDPETEVAYSRNALEPLTIVFKERKVKLTESLYVLFRYVYDLYRAEGQTEFEFLEIAEAIKGDDAAMSSSSIKKNIDRLRESLVKLNAPIDLTYRNEVIYVSDKNVA